MLTKIPLSCLLILTSQIWYTECFLCTYHDKHGVIKDCTKHCCGILERVYCKESCDGVKCERDVGCGDLCCKDGICRSCSLGSKPRVGSIFPMAVGAVVFIVALALIVHCVLLWRKRSAPRFVWAVQQGTAAWTGQRGSRCHTQIQERNVHEQEKF